MNDTIETVKIVREDVPGGYCIINKEDLRPEDVIYGEIPQAPQGRTKRKTASQEARG